SGGNTQLFSEFKDQIQSEETTGQYKVKFMTEGKIKENILNMINNAENDQRLSLGLFYLSYRDVIAALKEALDRGVEMRINLDINKDGFSNEKNGVPNNPVANELNSYERPPEIRW